MENMFRPTLSWRRYIHVIDLILMTLLQVNKVLSTEYGEELNATDWVRLAGLGSRLGADLLLTESLGTVLRWEEMINVSTQNTLYFQ